MPVSRAQDWFSLHICRAQCEKGVQPSSSLFSIVTHQGTGLDYAGVRAAYSVEGPNRRAGDPVHACQRSLADRPNRKRRHREGRDTETRNHPTCESITTVSKDQFSFRLESTMPQNSANEAPNSTSTERGKRKQDERHARDVSKWLRTTSSRHAQTWDHTRFTGTVLSTEVEKRECTQQMMCRLIPSSVVCSWFASLCDTETKQIVDISAPVMHARSD